MRGTTLALIARPSADQLDVRQLAPPLSKVFAFGPTAPELEPRLLDFSITFRDSCAPAFVHRPRLDWEYRFD